MYFPKLEKRSRQIDLNRLIPLAKETIGTFNESDKISISFLAQQIKMLYKQKEIMIERMNELVNQEAQNLLTIPGMGANLACTIYGEIGNINNFNGPDSLVAFAGLNPFVYQSGKYEAKGLSMSKRGSSYLRNSIILASRLIVRKNPVFKDYFEKKRSEGKHYNNAIGHVATKLIRVIYHMLKYNESFR